MNDGNGAFAREAAPLFILASGGGDDLRTAAARDGWRPVSAPPGATIEAGFVASGASVAVVDARHGFDEAITALDQLADAAEANAAALLVLVSGAEAGRLGEALAAGATHFLASPFGDTELGHALRFAARHAERLGGGSAQVAMRLQSGDRRTALRKDSEAGDRTARRDPLTGLLDGSAARAWLEAQLGDGHPLGLLLVGLDRLQLVNSFYGRAGGDRLLQAAARRIEATVRKSAAPESWVGRLAGSEFLIGLPAAGPAALAAVAEAVRQAVERRFVDAPDMFVLNAHIGGAIVAKEDAGTALRRVSAALAEAREAGGSRLRLVESGTEDAVPRTQRLAEDLRRAIAGDQIETLFQPIVCIAEQRVDGVEALSRWRHPALGEIGADALFAAAERAQLMGPLTEHIQQQALRLAAAWPATLDDLRLSLNVGASEIARPHFARDMLARIDASGFPRARVTLEVTEEGLIEELGPAGDTLAELRRGGCRVAVDDFGTGYSSLAYLKALPLDYLKLDKRLSQDITGSPRDRIVVRSVIDMARSLGLGVVAEGVETEEQLAMLAAEGCTFYQGYLCAAAVAGAELPAIVAQAASLASPRDS